MRSKHDPSTVISGQNFNFIFRQKLSFSVFVHPHCTALFTVLQGCRGSLHGEGVAKKVSVVARPSVSKARSNVVHFLSTAMKQTNQTAIT